jgi:hypothetical protein
VQCESYRTAAAATKVDTAYEIQVAHDLHLPSQTIASRPPPQFQSYQLSRRIGIIFVFHDLAARSLNFPVSTHPQQ